MLDQVVPLLLRESKSEEPVVVVHDIPDRREASVVIFPVTRVEQLAGLLPSFLKAGADLVGTCLAQEGREALDFDEVDAMCGQPVAHSCPRVGLPLLPGPHALGGNDQKGQPVTVGRLDDPGQIGARGSQLGDQFRGRYDQPPGDKAIVALCSRALALLIARSATTPASRLRATGFGT